jgi:hypothetical protein
MAFGFALLPGSAIAQQKSLKEQLVGTWTLVSNDNIAPDGTRRQLLGPNPKGILILDANGRYAAIQVDPNRPKFKINNRLEGTPEENKAAMRGATASFGTWSVNEADRTLISNVEGALFPNSQGTVVRRSITLTGDELRYINPETAGGRAEAVYRRAK